MRVCICTVTARFHCHIKHMCSVWNTHQCNLRASHKAFCMADLLLVMLHRMQNGRKTRSERLEMPTFFTVIEIRDRRTWLVHADVASSVDSILAGQAPATECRQNV